MLSIGENSAAKLPVPAVREPKDLVAEAKEAKAAKALEDATSAPLRPAKAVEGVTVTISGAALKAAGTAKKANSDIEESGLPDNIQQTLKMIRQIKEQIAKKQAELAAVMADTGLTPDQARVKASILEASLSALLASLVTALASLA